MIVRSFLKWYQSAPVSGRIEAVEGMVDAYLFDQLGSDSPAEAEAALTLVLDDPAPAVRRALAWKLALSEKAPRHLLVGLAHDRAEVSSLILARSPQLRDADLIDCARTGDALTHLAVALRSEVSRAVSRALADIAGGDALTALCRNPGAEIPTEAFAVMVRRHPECGALREALAARDDLPADVRQSLVASLSAHLMAFIGTTGLMEKGRAERLISDSRETATLRLAFEAPDLGIFVDHLRETQQLTPSLLLRGVLCGDETLFGAALVCLSGMAPRRVAGILKSQGPAFSALYHKVKLPPYLLTAFGVGLSALREAPVFDGAHPTLSRFIIQRVLSACLVGDEAEMRPVLAMLRRFDAEAAREDARRLTADLLRDEAPDVLSASITPTIDLDAFQDALMDEIEWSDEPVEQVVIDEASHVAPPPATFSYVVPEIYVPEVQPLVEIAAPEPVDATAESIRDIIVDSEPAHEGTTALVAELIDQPQADTDAIIEADMQYHDELNALFSEAFRSAEPPSATALRVIESPAEQLDESFFANWDIRRNAA